jgi:hypothetical protein
MMPVVSRADKAYIRSQFVNLAELCRASGRDLSTIRSEFCDGLRPRPSYVLDDGTEFVPRDYFQQEIRRKRFVARLRVRSAAFGRALTDAECDAIWSDYLEGTYGKCLIRVSPESIVEKGYLMESISALIEAPAPGDSTWRRTLRAHVDALDSLERPFCDHDRALAGGPVSRDRLVTNARVTFDV